MSGTFVGAQTDVADTGSLGCAGAAVGAGWAEQAVSSMTIAAAPRTCAASQLIGFMATLAKEQPSAARDWPLVCAIATTTALGLGEACW